MKGQYNSYDLGDLGVRHTFSVCKVLDSEKIPSMISLAYNHGADDVKLRKVSNGNGWQYEFDFEASKYEGQNIRNELMNKGYVEEAVEIDTREEEILKEKLKYIM